MGASGAAPGVVAALLGLGGCGRVGFDRVSDATGPTPAALMPGDLRVYYASIAGDLASRSYSHTDGVWSPSTTIAQYAPDVVSFARSVIAPTAGTEMIGVLVANGPALHALAGPTWTESLGVPLVGTSGSHRGFDLAFSAATEMALAVYSDGTPAPQYQVMTAASWSQPQPVFQMAPGSGNVDWVALARHPTTDELTLIYSDTNHSLFAAVWDGAAWGPSTLLDTMLSSNLDFPAFAMAYEAQSGNLLVAWSHTSSQTGPSDPLYYTTKLSGTSAFAATGMSPSTIASPGSIVAASDPSSDRIAFSMVECCAVNGVDTTADASLAVWDGAAWPTAKDVDPNLGVTYRTYAGSLPTGVAWLGSTGRAVSVFTTGAADVFDWATWMPGNGAARQPAAAMPPQLAQRVSFATENLPDGGIVVIVLDSAGQLWAKRFDGTAWTDMNAGVPIATNVPTNKPLAGRPFGIVAR